MVQAHRTSSNFLEPQQHRDRKVRRVLSHDFGVVRLYLTFSLYIVTGETGCAGCLCPTSWLVKPSEPHRTFSNHIITEIATCVSFYHMSSEWFDSTEPSIYSVTGKTRCASCLGPKSGWFKHIEPPRTFSHQFIRETANCGEFCHLRLFEWP